ncbi:MAG: DUF1330 domain-containing protein [Methyloligellaceae bacterium]
MSDDIIQKLIATHGEGGAAPTLEDWQAIFQIQGSVPILNLLKFKPSVTGNAGNITGEEAYGRYANEAGPAFARAGGQQLFYGKAHHIFGTGDTSDWDAVILTRYPSAKALANMWLDTVFIAAHRNRLDALERSQVLVFDGNANRL